MKKNLRRTKNQVIYDWKKKRMPQLYAARISIHYKIEYINIFLSMCVCACVVSYT